MQPILLIARMTFLEARRNRVTWAAAFFCLLIVATSFLFQEVTIAAHDRIMRDVGFASLELFAVFLAIFLGVNVVTREIERRTVYPILSKPVGRGQYLVGKLVGAWFTVVFSLSLMFLALVAQTLFFNNPISTVFVQALWLMLLEALLLISFSLMCGVVASPVVSSLTTFTLFFAGHFSTPLYFFAVRSSSAVSKAVGLGLFFLLPNLERLNLKQQVSLLTPVSAESVLLASTYAMVYITAFAAAAILLFRRRDLK